MKLFSTNCAPMTKKPAAATETKLTIRMLNGISTSTARPPIAHHVESTPRLVPRRSARWPQVSPPRNDITCISAPKPKLAANVSPRCIITVGIQPVSPKMQNRLRNAAVQIVSVLRR